jgi:site-specific recombinase XerD
MTRDRDETATARAKRNSVGPLALHIDGFAAFLSGAGYNPKTVDEKSALLADLSRWLGRHGLPLGALDETQFKRFHADRRRRGKDRRIEATTGRQLLGYLRSLDCIPALPPRIDRTPLDDLTQDFDRFLRSERALSLATSANYLPIARRFLIEHFGRRALRLDELRPVDVHRFILRHAEKGSRRTAQLMVSALRSFLRFLQWRGTIVTDLANAVPAVACWRLAHLPKSLPSEQVERLLAGCDRNTPTGRRDHAILLLLARLGLRAGEVVAATLDDLDWDQGEILVRGKGQRQIRLPLPADVGAALVGYLRRVRPACSSRRVFIRMRAPLRGLAGPTAVDCVVRRALKRAGLTPEFKGAHLLRHSLATDLLRRGASLTEIGQLLRHSQPTTTQIYAKVDIAALRGIALPWPGDPS